MYAVELDNVSKSFGRVRAVNNITLNIEEGVFLTLLGPSGCGKTTTLRLLAGFEKTDCGTIRIMGQVANDLPPYQRKAGMVFQNYALFPHMKVRDNIAFGLRMRGRGEKEIRGIVEECLRMIQLPGFGDRYPVQLSGGQQQRVALARGLAFEPDVLLLDEPLSNLDLKLRLQMRLELKEIQKRLKVTAILVTHDQGEALGMSDQVAVMMDGQIQQLGTPIEIYEFPVNQKVADFIGEANFFEGEIVSSNESEYLVDVGGMSVCASPGILRHYDIHDPPDRKVTLMVKPQKMAISEQRRGKNSFPGTIENLEYIGSNITYQIRMTSGHIVKLDQQVVSQLNDIKYKIGDAIYVNIEPETCLVLP